MSLEKEPSNVINDCLGAKFVCEQLLHSFEQAQVAYQGLIYRLISLSSFVVLAYTLFLGQNPYFFHDVFFKQSGLPLMLGTLTLASLAAFLLYFFLGVSPRVSLPIYAPEFAPCDTNETICELYEQHAADLRQVVEQANQRNAYLGHIMKNAVYSTVALLTFLTLTLLVIERPT